MKTNNPLNARHRGKRSRVQRDADLNFIQTLAVQGHSQIEIANRLAEQRGYRISRSQVQFDLARLKRLWLAASMESFADARAKELRSLDAVLSEAWTAWEKSKTNGEPGNSVFLEKALGVHDRKAKILGLNSAERHELSGPGGGSIVTETTIKEAPISEAERREFLKRTYERTFGLPHSPADILGAKSNANQIGEPSCTASEPDSA